MLVMALALLVFALVQGGRVWADAVGAEPVSHDRCVSALLLSVADGDGRLLGDAGAEYSGLHALFEVAELADRGAGVWVAGGDDAVFVYRRWR